MVTNMVRRLVPAIVNQGLQGVATSPSSEHDLETPSTSEALTSVVLQDEVGLGESYIGEASKALALQSQTK